MRFAVPNFFVDLIPQLHKFFIFLLTNTYLKCSNLNFYQIKNLDKQICGRLLDSFALKGGKKIRCFAFSLSYGGKFADSQFFADCSLKKFVDLIFAAQSKEICGFEFLDSQITEICGF
jgi:hypothetical protein